MNHPSFLVKKVKRRLKDLELLGGNVSTYPTQSTGIILKINDQANLKVAFIYSHRTFEWHDHHLLPQNQSWVEVPHSLPGTVKPAELCFHMLGSQLVVKDD